MNRLIENKLRKLVQKEIKSVLKEEKVDFMDISTELKKKYPLGMKFFNQIINNQDFLSFVKSRVATAMISGDAVDKTKIEDYISSCQSWVERIQKMK